jgi:hypothetical protein
MPAQIDPLPMFERNQPSDAALYNAIALTAKTNIQRVKTLRLQLENLTTQLEGRIATASPQFAALIAQANTLQQQLSNALSANDSNNTVLTAIQDSSANNAQNAQIQTNRVTAINELINSLVIGQNIQAYSNILSGIAAATKTSNRLLGTDSNNNILWRTTGSSGSGVSFKMALFSRRLSPLASGGSQALNAWAAIPLDITNYNNTTITLDNVTKELTVPPGEYVVFGHTTGCTSGFKCRLRNITNNTVLVFGSASRGTVSGSVIGSEPVNFISRIQGTFFTNSQILVDFQSFYEANPPTINNQRGAAANFSDYSAQQSALFFMRIIY